MTGRSLSFGSVASAYETFRLGYPDSLVDAVFAYAVEPVRTALEIGAGTGKATRAFLRRGVEVTATDPDPAMLAELRRNLPTVPTLCVPFERLPMTRAYDLVFAAASLHWTRSEGRWPRIATLLGPGGVFACFGGPTSLADEMLEMTIDQVRSAFLSDDGIPSPDGTPSESQLQWPGTELVASPYFADVQQTTTQRRFTVPAQDFIGYLSTVSAYLELPDSDRAELFERLLAVLPPRVDVRADITLHLARSVAV